MSPKEVARSLQPVGQGRACSIILLDNKSHLGMTYDWVCLVVLDSLSEKVIPVVFRDAVIFLLLKNHSCAQWF